MGTLFPFTIFTYYVLYIQRETFEGENFHELVKNIHGLLTFVLPKDAMLPNFSEKTFPNSLKTAKFTKVFSPKYGIVLRDISVEGGL